MGRVSHDERNRLIAEAYLAGQSLAEVAATFSLGETTVHSVLRKLEIPRRPQRKKKPTAEDIRRDALGRFLSNAESSEPDWCWFWLGCRDPQGYGLLSVEGRNKKAHRLSWEFFRGPIPDGRMVCHDCPDGDFPGCVNPHHLFVGTAEDNSHDSKRKGRTAIGDRNGSRRYPERLRPPWKGRKMDEAHRAMVPRGERHGAAKLTDVQALEIRERTSRGAVQRQLAREYGVSSSAIANIVHGLTYRHLLQKDQIEHDSGISSSDLAES